MFLSGWCLCFSFLVGRLGLVLPPGVVTFSFLKHYGCLSFYDLRWMKGPAEPLVSSSTKEGPSMNHQSPKSPTDSVFDPPARKKPAFSHMQTICISPYRRVRESYHWSSSPTPIFRKPFPIPKRLCTRHHELLYLWARHGHGPLRSLIGWVRHGPLLTATINLAVLSLTAIKAFQQRPPGSPKNLGFMIFAVFSRKKQLVLHRFLNNNNRSTLLDGL